MGNEDIGQIHDIDGDGHGPEQNRGCCHCRRGREVLEAQRKLGLDLAQVNAERSTLLSRPTVLIVDRDRTVLFVDVQPDYTARTEVADVLAALAALSTAES